MTYRQKYLFSLPVPCTRTLCYDLLTILLPTDNSIHTLARCSILLVLEDVKSKFAFFPNCSKLREHSGAFRLFESGLDLRAQLWIPWARYTNPMFTQQV